MKIKKPGSQIIRIFQSDYCNLGVKKVITGTGTSFTILNNDNRNKFYLSPPPLIFYVTMMERFACSSDPGSYVSRAASHLIGSWVRG